VIKFTDKSQDLVYNRNKTGFIGGCDEEDRAFGSGACNKRVGLEIETGWKDSVVSVEIRFSHLEIKSWLGYPL
jgi:hypothetical protein